MIIIIYPIRELPLPVDELKELMDNVGIPIQMGYVEYPSWRFGKPDEPDSFGCFIISSASEFDATALEEWCEKHHLNIDYPKIV